MSLFVSFLIALQYVKRDHQLAMNEANIKIHAFCKLRRRVEYEIYWRVISVRETKIFQKRFPIFKLNFLNNQSRYQ